jgi:hypothetical protein
MRRIAVAVALVIAILVGAGAGYLFGNGFVRTETSSMTTTATSVLTVNRFVIGTTTTFSTVTIETKCGNASSTRIPPGFYRFNAEIDYGANWVATAAMYNGSSTTPTFAGCYAGNGQGYFSYEGVGLTNTSIITVTAMKEGGGATTLRLIVNGNMNTTSVPYGTATVMALINQVCTLSKPCPLSFISATVYATPDAPYYSSDDAYLFNCTAAAASPQGCTLDVTSAQPPYPHYSMNIRWPFKNSTEPAFANCLWTVWTSPRQEYALCIPISTSTFVMAVPAGPPP